MSFVRNSLSRALGPKVSGIVPGRDGQTRKGQREAVTSVRPECSSSSGRKLDVVENLPPKVQNVASNAIISISNTLRSKARMFYVDSVKVEMDKLVDTTSKETSATRPSYGSHAGATSLGHSQKKENFLNPPASTGGPKESPKFLELTSSPPLKKTERLCELEADCVKRPLFDDDHLPGGIPAYLKPLNFDFFMPRELDFTRDDDCSPGSFDDGVSLDESSDQEPLIKFVTSHRTFDYKFSDFNSSEDGVEDHGPWLFEKSRSSTHNINLPEPSEIPSISMGYEENNVAASNKAYQAYEPESEGSSTSSSSSSSSCSGSLNTEAQYPHVATSNTKKMEDLDTSSANDSTCSEHESDLLTELARFPNCFENPATDDEEAERKNEMPMTETQSIWRASNSFERPFNAAKLPEFYVFSPGSHVSQPGIQPDSNRWVLPPLAIPHGTANDYENVGFTDCEEFW